VILIVLVGLYVGFAKAGVVHSPFFVITEGDVEGAKSDEPGLRVLFIGNSFTFYNDMPHMVQELAEENPDGPSRLLCRADARRPGLDLWDDDGHHPNRAGSYLAACVFYAELTGHSPTGSAFTAGLDGEDAHVLPRAAAYVVRGP
jgi:hypothetical protein